MKKCNDEIANILSRSGTLFVTWTCAHVSHFTDLDPAGRNTQAKRDIVITTIFPACFLAISISIYININVEYYRNYNNKSIIMHALSGIVLMHSLSCAKILLVLVNVSLR